MVNEIKILNITIHLIIICLLSISSYSKNTVVQLISPDNQFSQLSFQSDNNGYIIRNLNNGTANLYNFADSEKIISINSYDSIEISTHLILDADKVDLLMTNSDSHLSYDGVDQWTLIYLDDFQGSAMGWSKEKLSNCGTNDNMFLGGHCNFGGEEVSKNYTDIPMFTNNSTIHLNV